LIEPGDVNDAPAALGAEFYRRLFEEVKRSSIEVRADD
jgi:hypothetical protein